MGVIPCILEVLYALKRICSLQFQFITITSIYLDLVTLIETKIPNLDTIYSLIYRIHCEKMSINIIYYAVSEVIEIFYHFRILKLLNYINNSSNAQNYSKAKLRYA
jgi:predicted CDP-diglyceride synthetase/phosphatidate cytidylyltransferase